MRLFLQLNNIKLKETVYKMKVRYKKPTGIPAEFVVATRLGWTDSRTGEVLESIPNLVERLADYDQYMNEMHDRQAESDVDDIAPYGVSSFEVHNKSESLKIQSQQEYQAHSELQQDTPKTEAIEKAPEKAPEKTTPEKAETPKPRRGRASKNAGKNTGNGAEVGTTIVIK